MHKANCNSCGRSFVKTSNRSRFCSVKCRNKVGYKRHRVAQLLRLRQRYKTDEIYREKIKTQQKEAYLRNPTPRREAAKRYIQKRDKFLLVKKRRQAYRKQNKELIRKRLKAWRDKYRSAYPWRSCLDNAKRSVQSKKHMKNMPFDLTDEWARSVWTGKCQVTGIDFQIGKKENHNKMYWPSIDRIVPEKGYVQTNCRFILLCVNSFKMDGTDEDMFEIAKAIVATL